MAWIESHQELGRHPKTRRLARLLDCSVPAAIGHLHLLWWWATDYAPNGDLSSFSPEDLAPAAMWEGDPGEFMDALTMAGFVDDDDISGGRLHDWDEYGGRLADKRAANRERKRESRARHAPVTVTCAPVTGLQNRTEQNRTEPPPTVDAVASDAPEPPAGSEPEPVARIAKPKRRDLTIAAIAELQAEMPGVDMDAAAADYLNWSGSAKHVDKVQGLRNQLREEWRRKKFARGTTYGEYGVFRAVNPEPEDPPYEPPDDGQALHRGRVWRAVLQRLANLDPPLSGQFQHALRGSAWAGQEGNVAIVVTRSAAGAEHLADMAGILAAELRAADPGTVFDDVEVRMPARGGVA